MPKSYSDLCKFILEDLLVNKKYKNLLWVDKPKGIFGLKYVTKSKCPPVWSIIYKEYENIKPRLTNATDPAQRLLRALDSTENYIKPLKDKGKLAVKNLTVINGVTIKYILREYQFLNIEKLNPPITCERKIASSLISEETISRESYFISPLSAGSSSDEGYRSVGDELMECECNHIEDRGEIPSIAQLPSNESVAVDNDSYQWGETAAILNEMEKTTFINQIDIEALLVSLEEEMKLPLLDDLNIENIIQSEERVEEVSRGLDIIQACIQKYMRAMSQPGLNADQNASHLIPESVFLSAVQNIEGDIFTAAGLTPNGELNACIYSSEPTLLQDPQHYLCIPVNIGKAHPSPVV